MRHTTRHSTVSDDFAMHSTICLHSVNPALDLRYTLLQHQVFCDGFRFREVESFERGFVDDDATFFGELFWLPTFFDEPFCDLLAAAGVEWLDDVFERLSRFGVGATRSDLGRKYALHFNRNSVQLSFKFSQ